MSDRARPHRRLWAATWIVWIGCGSTVGPVSNGSTAPPDGTETSATPPAGEDELGPSSIPAPQLTATTECGHVGGRPLGDEVPLLDGRLMMRPVQGAAVEARPHDIMGAPEPTASETRLFLEAGSEKVVVMAYELFALAGDDWVEQVRQDASDHTPGARLERAAAIGTGLEAVQLVPRALDTSSEAVFTYGLYVVSPDRTVQFLAFYVNPEAARGGRECIRLAMRSAQTLRAGDRRLDLEAHTAKLVSGLRDRPLRLPLPAGYAVVTQEGPDFWVHRVFRVDELGQPSPGGLIYFGGHPSPFRGQDAETFDAPLLGESTTWYRWDDTRGHHAEALRPIGDHWVAHASIVGPTAGDLAPLQQAFGEARIER